VTLLALSMSPSRRLVYMARFRTHTNYYEHMCVHVYTCVYMCTQGKLSVFVRKKFVKFAWERCETELQRTFSVSSVSNAEKQISTLYVTFLPKKEFHWSNCLMHRLVGVSFVTDMSQTGHICLQTFYIFPVKIRIVFTVYTLHMRTCMCVSIYA